METFDGLKFIVDWLFRLSNTDRSTNGKYMNLPTIEQFIQNQKQ